MSKNRAVFSITMQSILKVCGGDWTAVLAEFERKILEYTIRYQLPHVSDPGRWSPARCHVHQCWLKWKGRQLAYVCPIRDCSTRYSFLTPEEIALARVDPEIMEALREEQRRGKRNGYKDAAKGRKKPVFPPGSIAQGISLERERRK